MNNHRRIPVRRFQARTRALAAAITACFAVEAFALPVAPQVVNGTATMNQVGNVLTVTNSNGAIINWQQFNIGAGETTRFIQPSVSSAVLNRVLAADPSTIYGTLTSNGRVWLVNPAGIMVGPGARIDVAGFVASTLNVSNQDFLAGRLNFNGAPGAGNVINQGQITTPLGGSVYLLGSNVGNEGIITTPAGETILAAGSTVQLLDSATPGVTVEITGSTGNATNIGEIVAAAGRIGIAGVIVRNSGVLNASSVVEEGGKIFLKASQDAYVDGAGRIITTGKKGGQVEVLGDQVTVTDQARIDASGEEGGGKVLVGGDWQGKNPAVSNSRNSYFGADAVIKVNATKVGAGGTAVVWADDTTRAFGRIEARGGAEGGNGGMVETSGKRWLDVAGARVDTRAADGSAGSWLLDPTDITIIASGTLNPGFSLTGNTSTISDYDINTALGTTNVTISTVSAYGGSGNITIEGGTAAGGTGAGAATIINTSGGARSLSLVADGAIHVQYGAKILGYGGSPLDVAFKANNSVNVGGLIATRGGSVAIAGNGVMLTNNAYGSGVINATTDGLSGTSLAVDSAYGGRVVIDAGTGAFSMAYGAFIGTTNQSRIVDANGDPTGLVAVGIRAGDVAIDSGATIKLNYASTTTYGGGGDLGFIPTGAGAIGLGDYYGGAFTLDNTELSRLIMPAAGTSNCGTGKEGCRIWIGNVFAVNDPLDALVGNIPVTSYNIVAHNANFALNGGSVTPKRVQLSTTGTINDYGGLGLQSGHLALIGGAGIGNENDGFSFYGNSLLLTSENGSIVATSTGTADLALRRATAPNGSVSVSAAGSVVLLPYFVGQAETAYSNFTLHAMGGLTLAGSGIEYTLNGAFGTLTETAPSSASIRTLQSTAGTTIELGTMTGNIAMHYGATISGTYGGPVAIAIGSEYGSVLLAGGIRSYGGNVVVAGDTGVTLGDGVNTTAGTFGINTRRDGASGGTQTPDADGYGGRILIDADNDRNGSGTFTMNAGAFIGSTNQSNMLNASGNFDANSAVAIGIIAADVAINANATIKLNTDSSVVYGGGGDIGFLPTGSGPMVLGNAYGGSFTLDNTELSRIIMPSATTSSCGTTQEGCRIWIGNTGAPNDPLIGALPVTTQNIIVNEADFSLNGAVLTPKRVHISTTGTLNDAGTGAYGGYFGVKAGHVYAFGGSGVGISDMDGMSFIAGSVALTSNATITATSVGGGNLALRRANANGFIDIAVLSGSVTLLPYFVGQMESTPGNFSLKAHDGNITFAQYGSSYSLTSPFGGTFTEVAPSTATIRSGGHLSLQSNTGSIAITGEHAAYGGISVFGGGGISITDGGLTTAGELSLGSYGDLAFTGVNRGVIVKSGGNMILGANNITLAGGNAINSAGSQAFYGTTGQEDVSYYGAGVAIRTSGNQTISASGDILLSAGNADNTQYGGGQFGGSVEMRAQGQQTISAHSMRLYGGAAGHDNVANVESGGGQSITIYGGELRVQAGGSANSYNNQAQINQYNSSLNQSILFYGGGQLVLQGGAGTGTMGYGGSSQNYAEINSHGSYQGIGFLYGGGISIYGGSAGTNNYAQINAGSGDQWIYDEGSGLQIYLAGGTSGGAFDQSNDGGINLGSTNTTGSQHVYAGSISIHAGSATYGGAGIGVENTTGTIGIYTTGNLSMYGGTSDAIGGNTPSSAAYIGSEYGANILLEVGGNLLMQAGTGLGGAALMGSLGGISNVTGTIGGNLTMVANGGFARIGSLAASGLGGASIDLSVGGNVALTSSATQTASIGTRNDMAMISDIGVYAAGSVSLNGTAGAKVGIGVGEMAINASTVTVEANGGNLSISGYGGVGAPSNTGTTTLAAYGAGSQILVDGNAAYGVSIGGGSLSLYGYGGISLTDASLSAYSNMSLTSPGAVALAAVERNTLLMLGSPGSQTVTAGSFSATGGGTLATGYGAYVSIGAVSGSQQFNVAGAMTLQGGSHTGASTIGGLVRLFALDQDITAGSLALIAGSTGHDNTVDISSNGNQTITVGNVMNPGSLIVRGGGGVNSYNNNAGLYQQGTGTQTVNIHGGSLALYGGAGTGTSSDFFGGDCGTLTGAANPCFGAVSFNGAHINANGGNQTINFVGSGTSLWLEGGSGGNNNRAEVYSANIQTITGQAAITLKGGASGGTHLAGSGEGISLRNSANLVAITDNTFTSGSQNISAASITLQGGGDASTVGGAHITAPQQTITVTGDVSLAGGGSNALAAGSATGAFIGNRALSTLDLTIGGNLSLIAGPGTSSSAGIGSRSGLMALSVAVAGNTLLSANGASAWMGSAALAGYGGGSLDLTTNNLTVTGSATTGARIGASNDGGAATSIMIAAQRDITISGANSTYGAGIGVQTSTGAANTVSVRAGALGGATPSGYGGNISLGTESRLGAGAAGGLLISAYAGSEKAGTISQAASGRIHNGTGTGSIFSDGDLSLAGSLLSDNTNLYTITSADGSVIQAAGSQFMSYGSLDIQAGSDIYLRGNIQAPGKNVYVTSGNQGTGNIGVNTITADSISLYAANAILDENGEGVSNLTANLINLWSEYGGVSGGWAISTDTASTGSIYATTYPGATYGGIFVRNQGAAPTSVSLDDSSIYDNKANFTQYSALTVGAGGTAVDIAADSITLISQGDLTYYGSAVSLWAPSTGSILIGAQGGNILFDNADIFADTEVGITATGNVTVTNSSYLHGDYLGIIAGNQVTVSNNSEVGAWGDLDLAGSGILFDNGRAHSDDADADITMLTNGDIRINNGSSLSAGNDFWAILTGTTSTLYLNESSGMTPSVIKSDVATMIPATAHITFTTRPSGGIFIDGAAYTGGAAGTSGGSGIFVTGSDGLLQVADASLGLSATNMSISYTAALSGGNTQTNTLPPEIIQPVKTEPAQKPTTEAPPPNTTPTTTGSSTSLLGNTSSTTGGTPGTFGDSSSSSTSSSSSGSSSGSGGESSSSGSSSNDSGSSDQSAAKDDGKDSNDKKDKDKDKEDKDKKSADEKTDGNKDDKSKAKKVAHCS